jgi:hypothetical protein
VELVSRRNKVKKQEKKRTVEPGAVSGTLDERGYEVLDPTPIAVPIGTKRPETLEQKLKRIMRNELSVAAEMKGEETLEEANDFNVGDDYDPDTPYSPYEKSEEEWLEQEEKFGGFREETIDHPRDREPVKAAWIVTGKH